MIDTPEHRIANHAQRIALEMAIQDRWKLRKWYRGTARDLFAHRWDDLEAANTREIRVLCRQLRRLRAR